MTRPLASWNTAQPVVSGQLDKVLDDAAAKGWTLVDLKRDWKQVFP